MNFFITGLPRSRTAWMAAACMTAESVMCYHEPIEDYPSWQEATRLWHGVEYGATGIADSGLGFHLAEILAEYRPRTLIIERDSNEVAASLVPFGVDPRRFLEVLSRRLESSDILVKRVPFDQLDERMEECLRHLLPGIEIDPQKVRQMQRFTIQVDVARVRESAAKRRLEAAAILGQDVLDEICEIS